MNTAGQTTHDSGSVDHEHPWIGLESFTEATRSYFYGREDEVAELSRRVQRKLLTVLFGQSGLGKTSILRAGIVPRLRPEGYCPVYVRVDYSSAAPSPSEQIKQAIHDATAATGQWTQPDAASAGESLWEFLHHRDDILLDSTGTICRYRHARQKPNATAPSRTRACLKCKGSLAKPTKPNPCGKRPKNRSLTCAQRGIKVTTPASHSPAWAWPRYPMI